MNYILIRNALIINEEHTAAADVVVTGDRIAGIFSRGKAPFHKEAMVIDATGMWLMPGIIDDHVHFREPGLTHKGYISSESVSRSRRGDFVHGDAQYYPSNGYYCRVGEKERAGCRQIIY